MEMFVKVNVENLAEQNVEQMISCYGVVESELSSGKGVYGLVWKDGNLDEVKYYGDVNEVEVLYEEDESNDLRYIEMGDFGEVVQVSYDEADGIDLIRI
jgi:hypothetical protein